MPKRDVAVGPGAEAQVGDTTVDIIAAGPHARHAVLFLSSQGRGRTLMVAYAAAGFNFRGWRRNSRATATRSARWRKWRSGAPHGAHDNHTEFDRAYDRARIAQLPRAAGEKHPYETDLPTVLRYFEMSANCAEAQRISLQPE